MLAYEIRPVEQVPWRAQRVSRKRCSEISSPSHDGTGRGFNDYALRGKHHSLIGLSERAYYRALVVDCGGSFERLWIEVHALWRHQAASCHKGGAYLFERVPALNASMGAEHRIEELTSFGTGLSVDICIVLNLRSQAPS